ncbi:MAG: hypothetical protein WBX00_24775 [Isosphaeraceae bacterium]
MQSDGNIGTGTDTTIDAETNADLHTYGLSGGGPAEADTGATSNQTVTVGQNATITAVGNINLTAGVDPTGLTTSTMTASSTAYSRAEGLVGVPNAYPDTIATSNAKVNVETGTRISSGRDATVGAYPGSPDATQLGTTESSALWIPIHGGGTTTTVTPTTSAQFTNDGTITAGYYHELTIDIPNQQNPGSYSSAITVNPDGSPSLTTSSALASDYSSSWDAQSFVTNNFVDPERSMLAGSVSTQPVGAFDLSQSALFASGGSVTVNAATIAGNGTIVAWGGPTVTITNESPDYLILGAIGIPNHSGGQVSFEGTATATDARNAGLTITQNQSTSTPTVTISLSSATGPALFLTGPIDNLGGTVSIKNSEGSIGQIAAISALTVNMSSPNGTTAIDNPDGCEDVEGDMIAAWNSFMTWPGGSSTASASAAAANLELGTYTASSYSSATPPVDADAAITAKNVAITAQTIDVDGQILCGESTPPNWSVYLPSNLKAEVSAYQQWAGLAPTTSVRLSDISGVTTVTPGDSLIDGTYDPVSNQITLDDVTDLQSGGSVYLKGTIISTNTLGQISVQGGSGTVDVNNQSGIPLAVQDITAGGNAGAPEAGDYSVEIDDTNPAGPSHKKYVYITGQPIEVYDVASDGTLETPTQVSAASTTFQPVSGTTLQWVERARLNNTGNWSWTYVSSPPTNPWVLGGSPPVGDPSQYLSTLDLDEGQVYINQQTFLGNKNPASFNFYASNTGHYVTPLVFSVNGGNYTLAAAYQSIYVTKTGPNSDPLTLLSGSPLRLDPNTTYVFGFCDQDEVWRGELDYTDAYPGTIPYDLGSSGDWLNTQLGLYSPVALFLDSTFPTNPGSGDVALYTGRVYAASVSFSPPTNQTGQIVNPGSPTYVSLGSNVFQETISQTGGTATYHDLTLTNTVKADNPIAIDFSGVTSGSSVTIVSNAPVALTGDIQHAADETSITADGDITNTAIASIGAKNLALTATGGSIGSSAQPLNVALWPNGSLTATADNQGVYLDLSSGANIAQITSGDTTDGDGDVSITADGNLLPESGLAAGTVNVTGDNITLTSTGGEVGNPACPLLIQANSEPAANGGVVGGVVNATAQADIGLVQNSGDLLVGTIQSTGHGAVAVSAPGGSILNAATWVAGGLSLAQASATWNALGLTDPAQSQQAVTAFENQVDGNYQQYWQLLGSGTVQNRSFTVRAGTQAVWNNATGGQFTLSTTVNGQTVTSGPIDYNASAAEVQTALNNLAGVQAAVTGSGTQADPWLIGGTGLSSLTTDDSLLTGGASTVQAVPAGAQWLWNHATGGQFTLSVIVNGRTETTAPIAYNASASAVQAALNALTAVQAAVTGRGTPADPWLITGSGLSGLTIGDSGLIGGIAGGAYNLNPDALSAYSAQAAAVLGITTTPTAAQVQSYTNSCLQQVVSFFDANLPTGWMDQLDFQAYNPLYDYQATPNQVAALTQNSTWTEDQLIYTLDENALQEAGSSSAPPAANIIGGTVTLTAGAGIGANRQSEQIPLANIKSANLTADQKALLAQATQAGNAVMVGVDAQGNTQTFSYNNGSPPGVTPTAIELKINRPVYVSCSSTAGLNISAQGGVNVFETDGNLTVGQISSAGGTVDLAATGDIVKPDPVSVNGFGSNGTGWTTQTNATGSPTIASDVLTITTTSSSEARAAWFNTPVSTGSFTASFTYTDVSRFGADGIAFVLQNDPKGTTAIGAGWGSLAYLGIQKSVAYEIDDYTVGTNFVTTGSTGTYNATGSIYVASGDPIKVTLVYDAAAETLTEFLADKKPAASTPTPAPASIWQRPWAARRRSSASPEAPVVPRLCKPSATSASRPSRRSSRVAPASGCGPVEGSAPRRPRCSST